MGGRQAVTGSRRSYLTLLLEEARGQRDLRKCRCLLETRECARRKEPQCYNCKELNSANNLNEKEINSPPGASKKEWPRSLPRF